MSELLHASAVAAAVVGVCCMACDRPRTRARAPELAASVVMLMAMTDTWLTRLVPNVSWAALLMACGMGIVHWRRPRSVRRSRPHLADDGDTAMLVHSALGMVLMGALHLMMVGHEADVASTAASHAHTVPLETAVRAAVALYAAASLGLAIRMLSPSPAERRPR
ncbi:hypothetical protein [Microbacterium aurantiacum]|uniref:DUF5134 domain-containing protein n=1 Tax=Microbacterium aurantiacum TaxID=162393 RepID=A0ABT8FVX1_9MICO|nr:hypothetical protein [Microbacterium aurantiacum]MDN4465458.1 hypothetical protein [Microbacterium aurantiacum]